MALEEPIATRLGRAQATDDRFGISVTVLAELYYAVYASRQQQGNLLRLHTLLKAVVIWPFDDDAAAEFGRIQAGQKSKGRPLPPMDVQIAAVARVHNLTVLTADKHFQYIDQLLVENWLDPAE